MKALYAWSHNRGTHPADYDSTGEIRDNRGFLLSEARPVGEIPGCKQPTHVPDLCEQQGISNDSVVEQFCAAIAAYCADVDKFSYKMLASILAAKHPIHPGCCLGHTGLIIDLELAGLL